jgi:hypothetical protein
MVFINIEKQLYAAHEKIYSFEFHSLRFRISRTFSLLHNLIFLLLFQFVFAPIPAHSSPNQFAHFLLHGRIIILCPPSCPLSFSIVYHILLLYSLLSSTRRNRFCYTNFIDPLEQREQKFMRLNISVKMTNQRKKLTNFN